MVMNFEARGTQRALVDVRDQRGQRRGRGRMGLARAEAGRVVADLRSLQAPAERHRLHGVQAAQDRRPELRVRREAGSTTTRPATPRRRSTAGSLQHHGEAALRLARRFASMDLGSAPGARRRLLQRCPSLDVAPHYSTAVGGAAGRGRGGALCRRRRQGPAPAGGQHRRRSSSRRSSSRPSRVRRVTSAGATAASPADFTSAGCPRAMS